MRIYFLFYFIYLISFSSYSQEDKKAVDLLDMMSEKYKKMQGFTSSFTYIMNNLSENIADSFQGKISVKEEMYVLFIEGQKIINDSKTVWTYLEDLNEVTISLRYSLMLISSSIKSSSSLGFKDNLFKI